MAQYPTKIITHAEMANLFLSVQVQEFLSYKCNKSRIKTPYRKGYQWCLIDDPLETVAVVWIRKPRMKENESPWYEFLVWEGVQYIPGEENPDDSPPPAPGVMIESG